MTDKKQSTVLVTGGTGLVGSTLIPMLSEAGFGVRVLSRSRKDLKNAETYLWNVREGTIEEGAVEGVDHIIHLAGESIGSGRWTRSKKKSILESRILPARLLFDTVEKRNPELSSFTSASATGYYGAVTSEHVFTESDPPGNDFAAGVCVKWEEAAGLFRSGGYRTSIIRTGIALSARGGMLARVLPTIKMGFSPLFGNGKHYLPWIHIDDLCGIYLKVLQDKSIDGIYNAVSPQPVQYREFIRTLAKVKNNIVLMPPTPDLPWKILFGEKSSMLLEGSRVSADKIIKASYDFQYPGLKEALQDLISKDKK
ncbi:MAG: TIGR01777 family oxidoreductase [Bacteroidales bacterium]|nr:TIGR01777 family oxidoreductase [Bacteroidales bacterium]